MAVRLAEPAALKFWPNKIFGSQILQIFRRKYTSGSRKFLDPKMLCKQGKIKETLKILQATKHTKDSSVYVCLLEECIKKRNLLESKLVHNHMKDRGFLTDTFLGNKLIKMFAKCDSVEDARNVFVEMPKRDVFSWTAMISAFVRNNFYKEALELFYEMRKEGIKPNEFTFASIITACANSAAAEKGKEIHEEIRKSGFESDVVVGNALVDMHGKCGNLDLAREVFNKMPQRNVVSWTAMIAGYVRNGQGEKALKLYRQMQDVDVKPNVKTLTTVIAACADLAALEQGKHVHGEIVKRGFQFDEFVESAIVDMYAKCGDIEMARVLFDKMPRRNAVLWTTMIVGYAMHGQGKEAVRLFERMRRVEVIPDAITFVGVLSACCHAGLVDEGCRIFDSISECSHIVPSMEHYGCLVGILGRAGRLDEAHNVINKMPMKADATVWGSLLGASRIHRNVELGECAAQHIFELNPKDPGPYVVLSNMYAESGQWDANQKVRKMMKDRNVRKNPGCSWVEFNHQVHTFLVGDRSHPQTKEIYLKLERLSRQMKEAGYVPDRSFTLNDVDEEQKEDMLSHHSEKLAVAFGLINMDPRRTIRVIKNLRVCGDCHSAIKFISRIGAREILLRDANRFHHFKDGQCSCGDYW
ncbi:putative pentatricopeptide repeat-containing protein At3g13770, mitochondrial [Cryptomeria japonica]|uniref:putative pentatricopeptide repeat-containing protein At3g13770, mitochondrial n=1 Tax=Cryptomeria japonica TaxID=3369 RepID=UPI0027DA6273|nr:putative pentatricopeptide repeat-containing protein At3g13770, mitochondrial [Cryptomeria japonica]XP_057827531.2 putative pentatricopeptide repeat-containing protein At3g13770, mitochondrial [Cryptomeria japonica]XP_057827532.2 putative pentatricopeptide repeat-containing protein At3g13770, mitochondrial [Cryptomeria japonica]XP_057827533.2 putative pentatricopeptide repeat-containing protein At3g13770, mitochondrial [Cryptomeria japonica]